MDTRNDDPRAWCVVIALAFLALALVRLGIPSRIYFDETHYVNAARSLLALVPANREHPMFAKEVIAAAMALFGDHPLIWRLPSALLGALGLFAFGRLMWLASRRRAATLLAMLLLAGNFMWFVESRIATLDIYAAALALCGLWQFAAALDSKRARLRLALAGLAMGLAMASKWSAVPLAVLPGLAFLVLKLRRSEAPAAKRITLVEAFGWLGVLPLAIYWLTFTPAFFYPPESQPVNPLGFFAQQAAMIALQDSVVTPHTYQSVWWQWLANLRPVWFLYEPVDGAQRGILLLGNPLTMLIGLPALAWCGWAAIAHKRVDALVMLLCYAASYALWPLSGKPIQFYYHYLLPGVFLTGALALVLDEGWRRGGNLRGASVAIVAAMLALFAWFYPILSAAPLAGRTSFTEWMWLDSWR